MLLFIIRLLVTIWVVLAFRLTLGPKIAIAGVQPDLAAALVFYLTLARGPVFGILSGFVMGLLIDVDRPEGIETSSGLAVEEHLEELARCPNVVLKFGGLLMPINGFGLHHATRPPDSREVEELLRPWFEVCLGAFGPQRVMFESNFPVDRVSVSYGVLWNAFKRLVSDLDESDKEALCCANARRVYRL